MQIHEREKIKFLGNAPNKDAFWLLMSLKIEMTKI